MATRKSKLPSPGVGGGTVTKTLMRTGSMLKRTVGGIYNVLTGGQRQQTYGHIANMWPQKYDSARKQTNRNSFVERSTPTATVIPPMPGMDTQEILDLMKRNFEQEKRYREVQKSFAEERANEEQDRHEELIKSLKKFTSGGTTTPVPTKKEGDSGGMFDTIKDMMKKLSEKMENLWKEITDIKNWIKIGETAKKAATTLGTAAKAVGAAAIAGAEAAAGALAAVPGGPALLFLSPWVASVNERRKIEENPNAPEYKYNPYAMKVRGEVKTENEGAEKNRKRGLKQYRRIEIQDAVNSKLDDRELKDAYGSNRAELKKWLEEHPDTRSMFQAPVKDLADILDRNNAERSTAGAGRGMAQLYDYQRQQLEAEGSKAAFGVRPRGIKSVPVAPPPTPVAQLTDMNRDLEMHTNPMGDVGGMIVQQSNNTTSKNDGPLPVSAPPRDEEPMAAFVFRTQRRKTRAY